MTAARQFRYSNARPPGEFHRILRFKDGKSRTAQDAIRLAQTMPWWRDGMRLVGNDVRCFVFMEAM